jgi:hypothetical protein
MSKFPSPPERDSSPSTLSPRLELFCRTTGSASAALVDSQGETVDYAGRCSPFDVRLGAAECRILLELSQRCRHPAFGSARSTVFRSRRRGFQVLALSEGYALVVRLPAGAFQVSSRALLVLAREICEDAGLPLRSELVSRWAAVEVAAAPGQPRRPRAIRVGHLWSDLEVLGSIAGQPVELGECGYRARLKSGAELTLVRERLGRWFADPHTLFVSGRGASTTQTRER